MRVAVDLAPVARRIALLPPDVANQIAAGEVVERPASIVKELIENALDAGATSVTLVVDQGGISRIAVTDDGHGMDAEDLALSVVRHATSKIRTADDLVGVASYGFRGEAIPSIASVSKLRITSRTVDASEGSEVLVEGGREARVRPVGCAKGTTVSVEDLFFNTPARRKFLRAIQTESGACLDTLVRLALPRPDVKFVVRRDGKVVREFLRQNDVLERAREIWRDEPFADVRGERGPIKVVALLGPPERARVGTNSLSLYVNGRSVRDRVLLRAVAQAYGSTLEGGRYPVGAVLIEVPADEVDVNVHPQKAEVRFARQSELFAAITTILREGLNAAPWARATASFDDPWAQRFRGGPMAAPSPAVGSLFTQRATPSVLAPPDDAIREDSGTIAARVLNAFVAPTTEPDPWGLAPAPPYPPASYDDALATATVAREHEANPPPASVPAEPSGEFGSLRFVAQLRRMFLVCEGEHGMVVIDQHAAAERVTFDRIRRAYNNRSVAMQQLLVPETIEASAHEVALVEERGSELERAGIELTVASPTTLTIRAVPALMVRADPRRLARDVLAEIARQGNDFSRAVDLVLATMACHGSIRAGDEVAPEEARALLQSLDAVEFAGHCPHGRPIVWSIRWTELERRVGR